MLPDWIRWQHIAATVAYLVLVFLAAKYLGHDLDLSQGAVHYTRTVVDTAFWAFLFALPALVGGIVTYRRGGCSGRRRR